MDLKSHNLIQPKNKALWEKIQSDNKSLSLQKQHIIYLLYADNISKPYGEAEYDIQPSDFPVSESSFVFDEKDKQDNSCFVGKCHYCDELKSIESDYKLQCHHHNSCRHTVFINKSQEDQDHSCFVSGCVNCDQMKGLEKGYAVDFFKAYCSHHNYCGHGSRENPYKKKSSCFVDDCPACQQIKDSENGIGREFGFPDCGHHNNCHHKQEEFNFH